MYQVMIYYKNHAHVKRWDTPQNFFLAFIDELWKTPKIRILKKEKKKKKKNAGDSIILHMCTKNHNQVQFLRYGVTQIFLSFRAIFCLLLLSLTPQKIKILKKWRKHLELSSFSTGATKTQSNHVCLLRYRVWQT